MTGPWDDLPPLTRWGRIAVAAKGAAWSAAHPRYCHVHDTIAGPLRRHRGCCRRQYAAVRALLRKAGLR